VFRSNVEGQYADYPVNEHNFSLPTMVGSSAEFGDQPAHLSLPPAPFPFDWVPPKGLPTWDDFDQAQTFSQVVRDRHPDWTAEDVARLLC
jgi:hypothetical protein